MLFKCKLASHRICRPCWVPTMCDATLHEHDRLLAAILWVNICYATWFNKDISRIVRSVNVPFTCFPCYRRQNYCHSLYLVCDMSWFIRHVLPTLIPYELMRVIFTHYPSCVMVVFFEWQRWFFSSILQPCKYLCFTRPSWYSCNMVYVCLMFFKVQTILLSIVSS